MRTIIKIAIYLAIIAALAYGAVMGYTWYKLKTELDSGIQAASAFADITYKSIYVSPKLDGTIGVDGIVIKPKTTSDEFKVQSVRATIPMTALLTDGKSLKKGGIPERMRLAITGVNLDLNSPLLISLSQAQKQAKKAEARDDSAFDVSNVDALGCGKVDSFGLDELTRMGYQTMEFDVEMEYTYERVKNLLKMNMKARFKGMQSFDMKAAMRVAPSDLLRVREVKPVIDSLQMEVVDAGFAPLRNRFCAAQLESTEQAFIGRHIELLSRGVGATFPAESIDAYKKYLEGSGRVTLDIIPAPGTDMASIGNYPIKDAIDVLGLKLSFENHEVDFSKFAWGKTYSAQTDDAVEAKSTSPDTPVVKTYTPARYRATSPSRLGRYTGHQARLKISSGTLREGVIESAESGVVTLRLVSPGRAGFISFPISVGDIVSAEVLY